MSVESIVETMVQYAQVLMYAIPFFILLMGVEFLIGRRMGVVNYRPFDTISSISSGMTNTLKEVLGLTVVIISYTWFYNHLALYKIEASWWLYIICFVGLDFAGYWSHRFEHLINVFWNRHIVHHSSEEFNLACALRQPISSVFAIFTFLLIPTAILGVPPEVVGIVAPLHLFAQFWYHTRLIGRMGFLENIIVTPSHHRVHHAINEIYLDKNYGQIFILWDKWFGTYQEELPEEVPVYGVKRAVETWNPVWINFQHLWLIAKDAFRARKWSDKLKVWFKPTGWRPADVAEKYPVNVITDPHTYHKFQTEEGRLITAWSWFQLLTNLVLMLHMMSIIADITFGQLLVYGLYLVISIYAYTSLMDYNKQAIVADALKLILAAYVVFSQDLWFGISPIPILIYSMLSLVMSTLILYQSLPVKEHVTTI